MEWKNDDPRILVDKRASIVILRPNLDGGYKSGTAFVNCKDTYCIITTFDDYKVIHADEKWNQDWLWHFFPEKK